MSAEYCKMSSNNQASKGNEKTPINSSGNGTEKTSGNMETTERPDKGLGDKKR